MPRYIIGRNVGSDIVINDPSVSRNHAELIVEGGSASIRDLGSSNGTFVNGTRIHSLHVLNGYDIIKVGNSLFPWKNYITSGNQILDSTVLKQPSYQNQYSNSNALPVPLPNAAATLTLGICSIFFACLLIGGLAMAIIGLILGSRAKKLYRENPMGYTNYSTVNAGYICSIIGLILSSIWTIYWIIWVLILGSVSYSAFDALRHI